ncbi:hypothetical protein FKG94_28085 [Exilibacterium tricleocarpae]|uniref:Uncharacterized protein n=1 Tax=Exilibacterium tricleocarpae TaxID=2591008 RepID=A0A545SLF7_9GAMM|nr:hypothetical protein [Exilibacterium tricleocarpae]TQV65814.1 hypothetical protein FKG94_28085 [Exilibacterium tricleocarpae]
MSNDSWLCFDCREAYRRPRPYDKEVNCAKCNKPCHNIGYQIPVPPKRNIKAWIKLRESERQRLWRGREESAKEQVRLKHDLEQGISRLEALSANKGRAAGIKKMKKQLKKRSMTYGRPA